MWIFPKFLRKMTKHLVRFAKMSFVWPNYTVLKVDSLSGSPPIVEYSKSICVLSLLAVKPKNYTTVLNYPNLNQPSSYSTKGVVNGTSPFSPTQTEESSIYFEE